MSYRIVLVCCLLVGCERINVGNVGLLIDTAGASRGLQNAPTVSGWVTYNPFTQDVIEFPTTLQTVVWTDKEAISFGSVEGVQVGADVSVSFRIDPPAAPRFYGKFRQADLEDFAHGFLRNQVRDGLNEIASRMPVAKIYGEGKTELLHGAHKFVAERLRNDGILVDQLTFNSHLVLPKNVQDSINLTIAQTQQAEQARNRVAQIEAEAQQRVAQAKGEAEAKQTAADAHAYATLKQAESQAKANQLIAEAEADANRKLRESLNPTLVEYEKVRKWNGALPMIGGGAQTLVDLRALGADK